MSGCCGRAINRLLEIFFCGFLCGFSLCLLACAIVVGSSIWGLICFVGFGWSGFCDGENVGCCCGGRFCVSDWGIRVQFFSGICFIKVNVSLETPKQCDLISNEALMFGNGG